MSASDFVTVAKLTVPRAALEAVRAAELKGVRLSADIDGQGIIAHPAGALSDEDKRNIRRWRWHVLAILAEVRCQ